MFIPGSPLMVAAMLHGNLIGFLASTQSKTIQVPSFGVHLHGKKRCSGDNSHTNHLRTVSRLTSLGPNHVTG